LWRENLKDIESTLKSALDQYTTALAHTCAQATGWTLKKKLVLLFENEIVEIRLQVVLPCDSLLLRTSIP